ncbi:hypothetical protein MPRS_33530 [Mycobacterium paraseoulense]|nr:hypothetical protein MPRS_33530 [Mycobacterium paraseoulense]
MLGADLRQGVGAFDGDRIGFATLRQQASALVPADAELLGQVCCCILTGVTHDVPA